MINTAAVSEHLGLVFITDSEQRRGSVLFRAMYGSEVYAVKGYDPDEPDTYDRKQLLELEAGITREIDEHLKQGLFVDYVKDEAVGNWLLTRWIEGDTISSYTRSSSGNNAEYLAEAFLGLAKVLSDVHRAGYLHGDIQPSHVIIPKSGGVPVLIDWGLARRVGEDTPYSGGFVHFVAPEVAEGMLNKSDAIDYTVSAEIYSFGALMALCLTGETATDYLLSDSLDVKLKRISGGFLRPTPESDDDRETALASVIASCLSVDPDGRPLSMDEVAARLEAVS